MFLNSWLFVPGNKEKMLDKSLGGEADAVIWDLEDSVPLNDKPEARKILSDKIRNISKESVKAEIFVRINPVSSKHWEEDLRWVIVQNLSGIMMPKVESPDEVRLVSRRIAALEKDRGLVIGSVKIVATLETALGLLRAYEIAAAADRVMAICFGAEDFTLDMGVTRTKEGKEIEFARKYVAVAAAAAKVQAIDTVYTDLNDDEGLKEECNVVKKIGFTGKCAIHPKQVPIINSAFAPTEQEVEYAKKVVDAYQKAISEGIGVIVVDGRMVDPPVAERAKLLLERYKAKAKAKE